MKDIQDMNQKMPDTLTLQEQEKMLNADQKRVYDNIRNTLIHHKEHECLSVVSVVLASLF